LHGRQAPGKLSPRSKRTDNQGVFMATRRTTGSVRTPATTQPAEKATPSRREVSKGAESGASAAIAVSAATRHQMVAQSAYLRAERRGFTAGGEVEDWLLAEAEVDALLRAGNGRPPQ
jgi:hypothetical protein